MVRHAKPESICVRFIMFIGLDEALYLAKVAIMHIYHRPARLYPVSSIRQPLAYLIIPQRTDSNTIRTGEVFDDCCLVDGGCGTDAKVVGHSTQVAVHSTDRKQNPGLRRPRHGLLFLLSAGTARRHPTRQTRVRSVRIKYRGLSRG